MEPTNAEREEYARLIALKAWGARYFTLHAKISAWATQQWRRDDVFGANHVPFAEEKGPQS